jgi:hypothetical protein
VKRRNTTSTFPFASVLTILFVALKLTHQIEWSWLWVLSPLWIAAGFGLLVLLVAFIIAVVAAAFSK